MITKRCMKKSLSTSCSGLPIKLVRLMPGRHGIIKGSNMKRMQKDPDMLEEYDFSKGIQGKYSKRYAEGTTL